MELSISEEPPKLQLDDIHHCRIAVTIFDKCNQKRPISTVGTNFLIWCLSPQLFTDPTYFEFISELIEEKQKKYHALFILQCSLLMPMNVHHHLHKIHPSWLLHGSGSFSVFIPLPSLGATSGLLASGSRLISWNDVARSEACPG